MGYLKLLAVVLLALTACTPVTQAVVNEGVAHIKATEDAKARLALQAPCAVTIGAYNRALTPAEQRAVMALCGGETARPLTAEDLQRLLAPPR